MDLRKQCLCCGSVYDQNNKLISPPTKPIHQCTSHHQGPWTTIQFRREIEGGHPTANTNANANGNENEYINDDETDNKAMDIDLLSFEPLLIETFKSEIHEYNTEIELTFGGSINFIDKFAIFVDNIDAYKMNEIISIVIANKQEVFLSETVGENNISNHEMIDQKPIYVRCILQWIYFAFLNYIYTDNDYKQFYAKYYKTESDIDEEEAQALLKLTAANANQNGKNNGTLDAPLKATHKTKSTRQEDVDPFFQCFYECSALYNVYYHKKKKIKEKESMSLRLYLELLTMNSMTVLKLMNGVSIWISDIKLNSIRLLLASSNIDISLYEFSQLLQCITLQTQHAVWQRIQKNSENQISDKQNLSLCIHILLCIAIKDKSGNAQYPNTQNPDKIYAEFLDKIVSCLSIHFLNKKNKNKIVMEFGDLVEKLPLWLLNCDKILQKEKEKEKEK